MSQIDREERKKLEEKIKSMEIVVQKLDRRNMVQARQIQNLIAVHKNAAENAEKTVYSTRPEEREERQYLYSVPWKMQYGNTIVTDCEREAFIASFHSSEIAFYILSMHNVNLTFKQAIARHESK